MDKFIIDDMTTTIQWGGLIPKYQILHISIHLVAIYASQGT